MSYTVVVRHTRFDSKTNYTTQPALQGPAPRGKKPTATSSWLNLITPG